MLKIVNAFIKDHRQELGLKGYSKMSYLEKLKYLEGKVKGTKYEREIGKLTKPRVDEGIKKVLDKSGRGKNVRVKKEKKPVDKKLNKEMKSLHSKPKFTKLEEAKPSQTAVAKPKLKPKPKPKTTTKEALQEMPLDIGAKISEEQSKRWESRLDKLIKSAPKNYGNKKFMEIGLEGFKAVDRRFQKKGFETKDLKMYLSKLPSDEERLKVISAMEQEVERLVGVSTKGKGERLEQQKQEVKSAFDNKKDIGLRIGKKGYWGKVISMDDKGFVIEGEIGEPKSGARTNPYSKNREYYDYMDFNKKGKKRIPYTQLGSYGVMDKKPTF